MRRELLAGMRLMLRHPRTVAVMAASLFLTALVLDVLLDLLEEKGGPVLKAAGIAAFVVAIPFLAKKLWRFSYRDDR